MTELLEQAIDRIRALPAERQDDFARVLLRLTEDDESVYQIAQEEEASLKQARSEVARGEFATDKQVRAVWAKYGL